MPKKTKTTLKIPTKTKPVKKSKTGPIKTKNSKTKDLEKEIRSNNLKMGIIEVLNLSQDASSSSIEPNNPPIITSTPIKHSPTTSKALVETHPRESTAATEPELNPKSVEAEEELPLPLKQLEKLMDPQTSLPTVTVTPPTPEKANTSQPQEQDPQLLAPTNDLTITQDKRPPDVMPNLTVTPSLPKLRIKKILNRETTKSPVFQLINSPSPSLHDSVNLSIPHVDQSLNSSALTFQQVENLNRTLQIKTANLIEEKKMLENKLDNIKEKNQRESAKQEWKLKQAQMEIRMLKINIKEKEERIKNQEAVILSSYTGYEERNKPTRTEDKSYRDLLRDNKKLENMIATTRKQMEEETNKKEMMKREMLKAKRDLTETNNRIKESADDEAKKMIEELMRKNNTLTVDLDLANQKITDLKNNNIELVNRIKEISNSHSVAQSDIKDSEPYPTNPIDTDNERQTETHYDDHTTKDDDNYDGRTVVFKNSNMDHRQMTKNQHMINGPDSRKNRYMERNRPDSNTNKKHIVCKYYMEDRCIFGHRCFYNHPNQHNSRMTDSRPKNRQTHNRIPDLRTTNFQRPPDLRSTNQQNNRIPDLRTTNFQRPSPWQNPNALISNPSSEYNHSDDQFPQLLQEKPESNHTQHRNFNQPRYERSYSQTLEAPLRPLAPEDISTLTNLTHYLSQLSFPTNKSNQPNSTNSHPLLLQCS